MAERHVDDASLIPDESGNIPGEDDSDESADSGKNAKTERTRTEPGAERDERVHYEPSNPECVVCLQMCHHPVQLPCGHIFCFLCVKGVAARSHKCALCRADVPEDYFENPIVVKISTEKSCQAVLNSSPNHDTTIYKWFYEGRNGWWQYEDRASDQLEEAFTTEKQTTEILIAGFVYIVDIENMVQYRKNYPTRRRRIKRDKAQADKKGVAGLKYQSEGQIGAAQRGAGTEQEVKNVPDEQHEQNVNEQVNTLAEKLDKTL